MQEYIRFMHVIDVHSTFFKQIIDTGNVKFKSILTNVFKFSQNVQFCLMKMYLPTKISDGALDKIWK